MKLYELNALIDGFELEVDEETGEILNAEELDALEMERDEKIENIALWIKNLSAEVDAYKKEKESFQKKQKTAEAKIERLRNYLDFALAGSKFKTDRVQISYRKSESVILSNNFIDDCDLRFLIPQEPKVDKLAVKKALKDGEKIAGAMLQEKQNIQIK